MTDSAFQRSVLIYLILLIAGLLLATGLVVLALRRRKAWLRSLLQLVGIGLLGTCLWLIVDLAWPRQRALLDVIAGLHAMAGTAVLVRAFRNRKSG